MVDITPSDGIDIGDGVRLAWAPLDTAGDPITGEAANITLTIQEPGEDAVTKTAGDLTESSGTYSYVHKATTRGVTYGSWTYNGAGNADGVQQFAFRVRRAAV